MASSVVSMAEGGTVMAEAAQASQGRAQAPFPSQTAASPAAPSPADPARPGASSSQQRSVQRKAQVRAFPRAKKLEKLGIFSACKVRAECVPGWTTPPPHHHPASADSG